MLPLDSLAQPNSRGDLAARAEAIFYDALQITEATEQAAFVQATCDGDDELAGEVHRLLKAHCAANTLFSTASTALDEVDDPSEISASPLPENDPLINTSVGFYRLVKRIGEGGGGVVYLAEQEEPVRRRVALKIIKLGMDTQEVIARFEAERQALAVMDHPNIARVLEAGATATGRPYFVMEYVRGVKITEYCLEHQLDLRQRLGLFRQVCHAIQHSHQKGIIHRDIKPSNILITFEDEVPMPKVIDFGIAKATAGRVPGQTTVTAGEQIIGTPAYMSPEQLERSSMDIDTRSDIYSLGVVLAELLTGRTPFDTQELLNAGIDEMRRTLREQEPPKLSSLAKTLAAAGSPQALTIPASSLRGDLDWIVMKALEKDRNRRYQTARGLAMDVERYLAEEPVQARPPSRLYLLHKLVRRNKATFTGIAVAVIALVTGTTVSTTLYFKARAAERQQAELRARADVRERITRGAILVSQGRIEEADHLLSETEFPVFQPSLEAAAVFRSLGEWNAIKRRWTKAAARMVALVQVNQTDPADQTDAATRDLLMAAPALIEAGDVPGFIRLRDLAISRFARTTNPIAAEHVMKISALRAIEPAVLLALGPMRQMSERTLEGWDPKKGTGIEAWRCAVLGLMAYRQGHAADAIEWGELGLRHPDGNRSRAAMIHLTRAMSAHRLGQQLEAHAAHALGKEIVEATLEKPLQLTRGNDGGWFDWITAHILEREAAEMMRVRR